MRQKTLLTSSRCEIPGMLQHRSATYGNKRLSLPYSSSQRFRFVVSRLEEGPTTDCYLWVVSEQPKLCHSEICYAVIWLPTEWNQPKSLNLISGKVIGSNVDATKCHPGDLPVLASKEVWPKKKKKKRVGSIRHPFSTFNCLLLCDHHGWLNVHD
jgi:hypothetical protein